MSKKIKNITSNKLTIFGQSIDSKQYYTLDAREELKYFRDPEMIDLINSNKVILNMNDTDLSTEQSLNFLEGELIIAKDIFDALKNANLLGGNSFATYNDLSQLYPITFICNGDNLRNRWLYSQYNIDSNSTAAISPANMKLESITFSNKYDGKSIDVELYKNGTKINVFAVRDEKIDWLKVTETLTFEIGDALSCYIRDVTPYKRPGNVIITYNFLITSLAT
jgi:hypothetical protein